VAARRLLCRYCRLGADFDYKPIRLFPAPIPGFDTMGLPTVPPGKETHDLRYAEIIAGAVTGRTFAGHPVDDFRVGATTRFMEEGERNTAAENNRRERQRSQPSPPARGIQTTPEHFGRP